MLNNLGADIQRWSLKLAQLKRELKTKVGGQFEIFWPKRRASSSMIAPGREIAIRSLYPVRSEFTADLHAVPTGAKIEKPYLLVGASFGGLIVTHYASLHSEDVAGIVLVDSTHPEHNQRTLDILPPRTAGESPALERFRTLLWAETYAPLSTWEEEGLDFLASVPQMRASWSLGNIPLVVLTAGQDEWEAGFPPDVAARHEQLWLVLQNELVHRSTHSTHVIAAGSGHCIHNEMPEAVLEAIHKILGMSNER